MNLSVTFLYSATRNEKIVTVFLFVICVFVVYGANQCDSVKIFFALNKAAYNPALEDNAQSMSNFIDRLATAKKTGNLDRIVVYGYASPEGPFLNNVRLSEKRCKVIADLISHNAGIPLSDIQTVPGYLAWEGLRTLAFNDTLTPNRDEVIRILDEYIPEACTDMKISDQCQKSLIAIDNGQTYKWMLENLFPQLRFSLAVYAYNTPEASMVHPKVEIFNLEPELTLTQDIVTYPTVAPVYRRNTLPTEPLHRLAIKTNFLYDAALLPNLEVEWRMNDKWSLALEGGVAWWGRYSKDRSYRLAMVSPEVRRWIHPRAPWHGFYVGLFVGGGLYDLLKNRPGYRGEGAMGGLSVGYMWPIGRNLSLEGEIGGGYLFTRCKEYIPMDGHHVYQRTKNIHYYGPLKVKFSLVWRLWDINRSRRQSHAGLIPEQYEK